MSALTPLAGAVEVRDLLESLVGREVEVLTGAKGQDPAKGDGCLVGVYLDDTQQVAALVLLDVAAAAYLGGALGLVPVKMAQQAVNHGGLPAGLLENASEILNVLGSLLNTEGAPHVRLDTVYEPGHPIPADVARHVPAFMRRCDLEIDVTGYGRGGFSLVVV